MKWGRSASHWCRRCVHALVLELRTLLLAADENLAAQRRDGRAAGLRRELCFTQLQERVSCLDLSRNPVAFYLFEHVDEIFAGADSMSLEALLVSLVFKYVRTRTTCTTTIVQLRYDVCCSQSGAHHGQRDRRAIPSVAMWRNLGRSTIICARLW